MDAEGGSEKAWTLDDLQTAIKAAFFSKGVESNLPEDQVSLRYTELKQIVGAAEGPVADKSLSRALKTLVERGHLERQPKGREVFYRLTIPRAEKAALFAKSDSDAIQAAAQLGGIGDLAEGWTYYGVPEMLKDSVREKLQRASARFKWEIRETIDEVADHVLRRAVGRARGRMERADLNKVEETLRYVVMLQATGAAATVRGGLLWSSVEAAIPGPLAGWGRSLGLPALPGPLGGWTEAHTDALAKALGAPPEGFRDVVSKVTKKLEETGPLLQRFFEILGAEEGGKLVQELGALVALVGNLTAVTRV